MCGTFVSNTIAFFESALANGAYMNETAITFSKNK